MSEGGDDESIWAHILWQRHGLRFEDFFSMSHDLRLVYIASEMIEAKDPQNPMDVLLHSMSKVKLRKH